MEPFDAQVRLLLGRERAAQLKETMLAARKGSTTVRSRKAVSGPPPLGTRRVVLRPSR